MKIGLVEVTEVKLTELSKTLPDISDEFGEIVNRYLDVTGRYIGNHHIKVGILVGIHLGLRLAEKQLCPTTRLEVQ